MVDVILPRKPYSFRRAKGSWVARWYGVYKYEILYDDTVVRTASNISRCEVEHVVELLNIAYGVGFYDCQSVLYRCCSNEVKEQYESECG